MWNTVALEMRMRLMEVKMLGIGRMELRGRMAHGCLQDLKLRMVIRLVVLVRETRQVMVVQRMGLSRDRGSASRGQTRRRRSRPNPIQATAANRAGLPEGAAIARRQRLRREATAPIDLSRRGTLRAVSGGSRLFRRN